MLVRKCWWLRGLLERGWEPSPFHLSPSLALPPSQGWWRLTPFPALHFVVTYRGSPAGEGLGGERLYATGLQVNYDFSQYVTLWHLSPTVSRVHAAPHAEEWPRKIPESSWVEEWCVSSWVWRLVIRRRCYTSFSFHLEGEGVAVVCRALPLS